MRGSVARSVLCPSLVVCVSLLGCGGGDGGGGGINNPPPATATLSGTVRDVATQAGIANATVNVGSASTTSAANGSYTLQNLTIGPAVTILTTAGRFDSRTETINVSAGVNTHDVLLTTSTLYAAGGYQAYLPSGVGSYRAAIVLLPGAGADARPFVLGDTTALCSMWCERVPRAEFRRQALQLAQGRVMLIGAPSSVVTPLVLYEDLRASLTSIGTASGRAELARLPLLIVGSSAGGCLGYALTRLYPAEVIGFITMKGGCHTPFDAGTFGALNVPAYFFIGSNDSDDRRVNITRVFEQNRAAGALWSIAIEHNTGHTGVADIPLLINWMADLLASRVPESAAAGAPATLRTLTENSGWLGDRSSFAIGSYAAYAGSKALASWSPTERAARSWQAMVSVPDATGSQ